MTPTLIIALVSLGLSVISTGIAIASFWRTRQVQKYDYATWLQLEDEDVPKGVIATNAPIFAASRVKLVQFAAEKRLPAIYFFNLFPDAGGLMS